MKSIISDERKPDMGDAEPSAESGNDMHIHKPKPLHGIREFLSEIGVIVVGVLIALGLEQASNLCIGATKSSRRKCACVLI
jgi:hypothetical protein